MKNILEGKFRQYSPYGLKIARNPSDEQRLAYVNFERAEAARTIWHTMLSRLQKCLRKHLHVDPADIIRDKEGKYTPVRYHKALQAERDRERKDPKREFAESQTR